MKSTSLTILFILCYLFIGMPLSLHAQDELDDVEKTFPQLRRAKTIVSGKQYLFIALYENPTTNFKNIIAAQEGISNKCMNWKNLNYPSQADILSLDSCFFTLKSDAKVYSLFSSSGKKISSDNDGYLKENNWTYDNKWTIDSTSSPGHLCLRYNGGYKDGVMCFTYQTNLKGFKLYKVWQGNANLAYIYELNPIGTMPLGTMSIATDEGYGTIYTGQDYVMPEGVVGYTITGANASGFLNLNEKYHEGDVVPAYTGLLIKGAKGDYDYYAPTASSSNAATMETLGEAEETETNILHGLTEEGTTIAPNNESVDDYYFYKLYYLTEAGTGAKTLGFFWGANDGVPFTMPANKAYAAIKKTKAQNIRGFSLPTVTTPTGLQAVTTTSDSLATKTRKGIYHLSGMKMDEQMQLPAGVYIQNGKKIIIR